MTTSTTDRDTVARELLAFLETRTKAQWTTDRDLFTEGGMSSLFAMELVVHLESVHDIEIGGPDLRLDNFRTVDVMVDLVLRLRDGA